MKNRYIRTIAVLSFCFLTIQVHAQFLKADGTRIVDDKGKTIVLRGMGLGGWMLQEGYMLKVEKIGNQQHKIREKIQDLIGEAKTKEFYDAWLNNHLRKIDVDSMAAWGFNSIRLPMHYTLFTLPVDKEPVRGQNTWLPEGLRLTDQLLQWCKANKMYLILDLHGAPGGQGNDLNIADRDELEPSLWQSEANQQKMIALWKMLATRYANEPWIGAYDIINEPNWGFESADDKNGCNEKKNEALKSLMVSVTKEIRSVDQRHIIIIEGNCWGNNYNGVFPLWDNNMVVSFHKYWNYNDKASIDKFLNIRQVYQAPVWLGESGENSNCWFRDAIHLVESEGIGWCWWPLKKIGYNNPLEIKLTPGYQEILNYWADKGKRPDPAQAYRALMEFAENTKLENCLFHRDVIDAMFRQPHSDETRSFKPNVVVKHLKIAAVDYDLGRNGIAYFDKDTGNYWVSGIRSVGNQGHVYRNDGVDIAVEPKTNDYYVDHIEDGEWLQYTFTITTAGVYNIKLETDASDDNSVVVISGKNFSIQKSILKSGGPVITTKLDKGVQSIKVLATKGGFNFRNLMIELVGR